jgi:hypothetical protein
MVETLDNSKITDIYNERVKNLKQDNIVSLDEMI